MDNDKTEEYNNIPVLYCTDCLSLKIEGVEMGDDTLNYCGKCGSTNIDEIHIEEWENKYKQKYGKSHINKKGEENERTKSLWY